jgi:hypothetical protein
MLEVLKTADEGGWRRMKQDGGTVLVGLEKCLYIGVWVHSPL